LVLFREETQAKKQHKRNVKTLLFDKTNVILIKLDSTWPLCLAMIRIRQGKARQGKARQGKARQGKARQGKARQGKARQG
jgi:hypothetical protein